MMPQPYDTVTVSINGTPLDPWRVALPLDVTHGRSGIDTQPDAPECGFGWLGDTPPCALGDELRVTDAGNLRFVGRVAGLVASEAVHTVNLWTVTAIGGQAALGLAPVLLDRPSEADTDRVAAICAAAGVPVIIHGQRGVMLAADTIDRDALAALHQVCESSGGLLWQGTDGTLRYGSQYHREAPATQVLPDTCIVDGLDWMLDVDAIINVVVCTWGPEDDSHQVTMTDTASIEIWGRRAVDVPTICAGYNDAQVLGALILARRANPRWRQPGLIVEATKCTAADLAALAALDVSTGVVLPVGSVPSPTPGPLRQWTVEGWVETWDTAGHRWQLAISDRLASETSGLRTWAEMAERPWQWWADGTWIEQLVKVEGAA